jgi:excisionase family DNA binding protein
MKENLNEYLTVKELAKWVKLSESHIYFLVNKKKIPHFKLGGKLLFDADKIKVWIESTNVTQESEPKITENEIQTAVVNTIEKANNSEEDTNLLD